MDATAELELLTILDRFPDIREKDVHAWVHKVFRTRQGAYQPHAPINYATFFKLTMPKLTYEYPQMSPQDRMKMVGKIWRTTHAAA